MGILSENPQETWGNSILFLLASAMGYPSNEVETTHGTVRILTAEPDEVLEEALETIWRYKELEY